MCSREALLVEEPKAKCAQAVARATLKALCHRPSRLATRAKPLTSLFKNSPHWHWHRRVCRTFAALPSKTFASQNFPLSEEPCQGNDAFGSMFTNIFSLKCNRRGRYLQSCCQARARSILNAETFPPKTLFSHRDFSHLPFLKKIG